MFEVELDKRRRVITFRASGVLSAEELKTVLKQAIKTTDLFRDGQHIVVADMRGLRPMAPESAEVFGQIIRYGREHGTVLCVHMSDSSVQKLQANRLAREAAPDDVTTINVVSPEEAQKVIGERYRALTGPIVT